MHLSFHYIQHHSKLILHGCFPAHNAILPDRIFLLSDKYSDEVPHPNTHPSNSENPHHCSLQPDIQFCRNMSLHLKMYLMSLSPVPQKDLLQGIFWNHKERNVLKYAVLLYYPVAACGNQC